MAEPFDTEKFYFIGNNLSVDFVNTQIITNGEPKDLLESFADFVAWARAADLLSAPQAAAVLETWDSKPQATQTLKGAKAFRQTLRKMVQQAAMGIDIDASVITAINQVLREGNGYNEIVRGENVFEKRFHTAFHPPRQLLAPISEAAADLLCYGDLAYLRKCENPDCVLYFYDTTKNHRRRWCSMAACGNRAKAAAFYQRHSKKVKTS